MKRISVISAVLMVTLIIIMAFTINNPQISGNKNVSETETSIINVHAVNCPNCKNLWYCIDGTGLTFAGNCEFKIKCSGGPHTICIFCDINSGGGSSYTFNCDDGTGDIYVDCIPISANCSDCLKKTKK